MIINAEAEPTNPEKDRTLTVALVVLVILAAVLLLFTVCFEERGSHYRFFVIFAVTYEMPTLAAFILSMKKRTRALGLSMASTLSITGWLFYVGIALEQLITFTLFMAFLITALTAMAAYSNLPDKAKGLSKLCLGIFLAFAFWLSSVGVLACFTHDS